MAKVFTLLDAVRSLANGLDYTVTQDANKDDIVEWLNIGDQVPPTVDQLQAEIIKLQTEYNATEYQRDRASAYPSITDQLDQIYHEGIDAWKTTIAAVKAEYPKP